MMFWLAMIAGGIRHYLHHHGELPLESLSAGIPMNMRTRRGDTDENNQLGSMFMSLHTNIEDPVERMHNIHKSSDEAKDFGEQTPLVDALKLAGVFSPRMTKSLVHFYINNQLTEHVPVASAQLFPTFQDLRSRCTAPAPNWFNTTALGY